MPRIDQIVEMMLEGGFVRSALVSDSAVRLKDTGGNEENGIQFGHHQVTALVEEILPPGLFADLVMMEPVEFEYEHPGGILRLKVVPGPSLWRVTVHAPDGLSAFEPGTEPEAGAAAGGGPPPDLLQMTGKEKSEGTDPGLGQAQPQASATDLMDQLDQPAFTSLDKICFCPALYGILGLVDLVVGGEHDYGKVFLVVPEFGEEFQPGSI